MATPAGCHRCRRRRRRPTTTTHPAIIILDRPISEFARSVMPRTTSGGNPCLVSSMIPSALVLLLLVAVVGVMVSVLPVVPFQVVQVLVVVLRVGTSDDEFPPSGLRPIPPPMQLLVPHKKEEDKVSINANAVCSPTVKEEVEAVVDHELTPEHGSASALGWPSWQS